MGNRIQKVILNAAESLVDQGIGSPAIVDDVISSGFGRRLAYPCLFKRLGTVGLDVMYTIAKGWGSQPSSRWQRTLKKRGRK
ncbi:MAG: 3-hydroxyacyl-CoA dehydrogenase family protein [Dehalococcoidales bacterium]|nr:3-hydroxyacyl-CoA dehydrogenase family protein [Dehalococcoidales bacterium]